MPNLRRRHCSSDDRVSRRHAPRRRDYLDCRESFDSERDVVQRLMRVEKYPQNSHQGNSYIIVTDRAVTVEIAAIPRYN